MKRIKLVQHATEEGGLFFVQYEDNSHSFLTLDDQDAFEVQQLNSWLNNGNEVGEFVPVISGGVIPLGAIMWFCATRPPEGYLVCDGSEVSRQQYAELFRAIGTTYGEGSNGVTFNLPNLVGYFCRGWGPVSPLDPTRTFGSFQEDAVKTHAHELLPISHSHTYNDPGHIHGVTDPGHIHPIVDPGHQHPVVDPGHYHIDTSLSHMGYAGNFLPGLADPALAVTPPYSGQESGRFTWSSGSNIALADVQTHIANLQLQNAQANVITDTAVTNITIVDHGTNIPFTDYTGDYEVRPENIALLPVIRY